MEFVTIKEIQTLFKVSQSTAEKKHALYKQMLNKPFKFQRITLEEMCQIEMLDVGTVMKVLGK